MTKNELKSVVIIPARFQSTRFPGKPLAKIAQKTMIQHVYERASSAHRVTKVIVATDDYRIAQTVRAFGGTAWMTAGTHRSGTERVAEVSRNLQVDLVVNLQGDEPLIDPACIDAAIQPFESDSALMISTLKSSANSQELYDPNVVKVVTDQQGVALYFSRSPIPYIPKSQVQHKETATFFKHIGLYVYRKEFLEIFPNLPYSELEKIEDLEQLRFLENGFRVKVVHYEYKSFAVDTPEDLVRVNELISQGEI